MKPELDPALASLLDAFTCMVEGVVVLDGDLRVVHHNPASLEILGIAAPESFAQFEATREDGTSCAGLFDPAAVALRHRSAQKNQILGVRRAGEKSRWLSVTAVVTRINAVKPGVVVTFRDVSDEKNLAARLEHTQDELRERTQFLDIMLNALPCLVSYVDQEYVYRYCNGVYEEWFALKQEELVGRTVESLLGPKVFEVIKGYLALALSGHATSLEGEMDYKGAGKRYVNISYMPGRDADGKVHGVYCIVYDINAQVKSRALVMQKEQEISKLINNIPGLVGWWDKDSNNLHANLTYTSYFGCNPSDIRGQHISKVLGPELYAKNQEHIAAVLRGEAQLFEREITPVVGPKKHILTNYVPDVQDGEVNGFFAITTDITRVKEAEALQRQAESRLISNAKMAALGEMAGGIAHEINNPLAIIHGKAGQIQRALHEGHLDLRAAVAGISKIESTATRISKIVKGLRSFSRNADADPMVLSSVDKIIEDTLELNSERFRRAGIDLRINSAANLTLECRPVEISQVLMNLLSNAFYAVEHLAEKWVSVDVAAPGDLIRITVTDSGHGIKSEIAAKMMQPFFTTKAVGQGTGLGLSISKGIAETHNGALIFDADAANTRFVLEIPRAQTVTS